jgi:periplasmic protein TonB
MQLRADIWNERDPWQQPLAWSVAAHAFLLGGILIYGAIMGFFHGQNWGGGGGAGGAAIPVELVSNIPLPSRVAPTENIVANESKGLTKSEPEKKVEEEKDAVPIASKITHRRPEPKPRPVVEARNTPPPPPTNVVPYGQGGPISAGMYGTFNAAGAKGGFGFTGGGGDFGARFAWYVKVVRDKVAENWLKYEVDPSIHDARRVYVTFDIQRDGHPTNIQVETSSGVPSLDQSATRALQRINTFGPLPPEYPGNRVSVEFWFDYRR